MKIRRRQFVGAGALLAGWGVAPLPAAFAQAPVPRRYIVPGSPGTGGDTMARYMARTPFMALAPKGTPASVLGKMEQGFLAATREPSYPDFCKSQGLETDHRETAAELATSMPQEFARWKKLIALTQARST